MELYSGKMAVKALKVLINVYVLLATVQVVFN